MMAENDEARGDEPRASEATMSKTAIDEIALGTTNRESCSDQPQ